MPVDLGHLFVMGMACVGVLATAVIGGAVGYVIRRLAEDGQREANDGQRRSAGPSQ